MVDNTVIFSIFLIFTGAALLSTMALFTRQSLMVSYMVLGGVLGPWGLQWVNDSMLIQQTGDVGIIFLLFLLGLHLDPKNLWQMLKKATLVSVLSCFSFALIGYVIARFFHFPSSEAMIIGAALMFSSTIIALKMLPTTVLHHQHTGEVMISILLLQDLIAIVVLLWLQGLTVDGFGVTDFAKVVFSLPMLLLFAFAFERYVLVRLFARFDRVREYLFLLSIGWCLSMAEMARYLGLSHEVGAFIAGVSIASSSISLYIAESLKPVRDFFLVLFFFSVGATFNLSYLPKVIVPAAVLATTLLVAKPFIFKFLLEKVGEMANVGWEIGVRLGQLSEFSLLVAYFAADKTSLISKSGSFLIQAATILSFMLSSYWVVRKYPTPIAVTDQMRRD